MNKEDRKDLVERLREEASVRAAEKFEIFTRAAALHKGPAKTFEQHLAEDVCHLAATEIEKLQLALEQIASVKPEVSNERFRFFALATADAAVHRAALRAGEEGRG